MDDHDADEDADRAGDVVGALLVVKGLAGASSKEEDEWFESAAVQFAEPLQTGELLRGCSTLMRWWLSVLRPEDPLHAAAAILNRLRRLDLLGDEDLPMLAAILVAVVLDQSPVAWAGRAVSEFTAGEQQGWVLVTWLVADLFDHSVERPGAAFEIAEHLLLEHSVGEAAG